MNPDVKRKNSLYESDVNKKITVQCLVVPNTQELEIHWYKDGVLLVNRGLDIMTGSLLILRNVQLKDSGRYTCQAGNSNATTTVLVGGGNILYVKKSYLLLQIMHFLNPCVKDITRFV